LGNVRELRSGQPLEFRTRCSILDDMFNADPSGEAIVRVPEALLDPLATVIEIDIADA
jgi:hypothetical protein